MSKILISVIGGHKADKRTARLAQEIGSEIARLGAILVCGGLSGVMKFAAKGAKQANGITVGILPGEHKKSANRYIDIPIATGLGFSRNTLVSGCADIVVALAGEEGTLSEIAFALVSRKPVISLNSWNIPGVIKVKTVSQATEKLKQIISCI